MQWIDAVQMTAAGAAAGAINALVGSGTLVTFPVLLALGYPPVVANASNAVGLVPGSFAAAYGYRAELRSQRHLLLPLAAAVLAGGVTGALLLLILPAEAFRLAVPILIALALLLIVCQPWLVRALNRRATTVTTGPSATGAPVSGDVRGRGGRPAVALIAGVFAAGVYGGYFGAALGVLLLGLLGTLVTADLQQANGLKNILAGAANSVAALVFVVAGVVAWLPALLIGVGAVVGGMLAARYGRRLPAAALRAVIVVVGLTAIVQMVV
ncbi:sulfite exporter TauE/SafE family protein [Actinoplanes utahensis]|uniref:Probable membrane transporter protein n=1 Tax=Actinoplanes utahensis TaxID=1869 RepID=A0A0A6XDA6_ACTUT|nr:sulfite exporter TauE/SafE family protein [Actinoplanes utahensis]KHD78082.1 membrane protein [Actinoplanes utahensis]GIF30530.1 UPF0721 transmembrane protein [Actinoplanes utahensis]